MKLDPAQKLAVALVAVSLLLGVALLVKGSPARKPDAKAPPPPATAPEPPAEAPSGPPPPPAPLQKSQTDDVKDILDKATKRPRDGDTKGE